MTPDATKYNPAPDYLRGLLERAQKSQREAARIIGIEDRTMRYYLSDPESQKYRPAPYVVQFALECLANGCELLRKLDAINHDPYPVELHPLNVQTPKQGKKSPDDPCDWCGEPRKDHGRGHRFDEPRSTTIGLSTGVMLTLPERPIKVEFDLAQTKTLTNTSKLKLPKGK